MAILRTAPADDGHAEARRLSQTSNGVEREQLADIQCARMLAAMAEVACELGLGGVTVAHVVARSGVSRRTFYEHFADRQECFLAAFEEALRRIGARVVPAYRAHEKWHERIRAALGELLCFLDHDPFMGGLAVVQVLGGGPVALERRQRALRSAIAAVDEGRAAAKAGSEPPPLAAEAVVGAVFSVIHTRFLSPEHPPLVHLTNELMSMIVLPYLGPAAARRELARPLPDAAGAPAANGLRSCLITSVVCWGGGADVVLDQGGLARRWWGRVRPVAWAGFSGWSVAFV